MFCHVNNNVYGFDFIRLKLRNISLSISAHKLACLTLSVQDYHCLLWYSPSSQLSITSNDKFISCIPKNSFSSEL